MDLNPVYQCVKSSNGPNIHFHAVRIEREMDWTREITRRKNHVQKKCGAEERSALGYAIFDADISGRPPRKSAFFSNQIYWSKASAVSQFYNEKRQCKTMFSSSFAAILWTSSDCFLDTHETKSLLFQNLSMRPDRKSLEKIAVGQNLPDLLDRNIHARVPRNVNSIIYIQILPFLVFSGRKGSHEQYSNPECSRSMKTDCCLDGRTEGQSKGENHRTFRVFACCRRLGMGNLSLSSLAWTTSAQSIAFHLPLLANRSEVSFIRGLTKRQMALNAARKECRRKAENEELFEDIEECWELQPGLWAGRDGVCRNHWKSG
jgi:hypothetical protein